MLDPTQLRYFKAIAEHGSLSAAARSLRVSQPALSQSVKSLERQLGATLLARSARGVSLTEAGQRLLHHAERVLAAIRACETELRAVEEQPIGHYTIGCEHTLGPYLLPGLLRTLAESAPELQIAIEAASSAHLRARILAHEVHVGIVADVEPHPSLVIVELFTDAFALVARERVGVGSEVPAGPLVHVEGIAPSDQLIGELERLGVCPDRRLPCRDLELAHTLVASGLGVGVLPERVATYGAAPLVPVSDSLPTVSRDVSVIYRADTHRTHAARLIKEAAVAHARSLQPAHARLS